MSVSSSPIPAEAQLVERALGGDREAFGDLYEFHLSAIYRYIYYRVGDGPEAEDLTETVFLKAWQAIGTYKPSQVAFVGWLYRIAHNLLVDRYRTHRAESPLADDQRDTNRRGNPESEALATETAAELAKALSQLDPLYQEVLALRFASGLSHAETARIIGRNEAGVRVIQHRALALLRSVMTDGLNTNG